MRIEKKEFLIYVMIAITLVVPLTVGLYLQSFALWRFVSLPLHSTMESIGGIIAFILSVIIFMMYQKTLKFNQFHRASFALLSMGVFDIFHAIVYPGELFVWLHSLAIFFGGLLFSFVWVPDTKVSRKVYLYLPTGVVLLSVLISVVSILFPSIVPQMLTSKKEFTDTANLLNMIGGVLFVVAAFYFIKNYLKDEQLDDLLFAGHAMLFGSAGVLFFFSSLWDISWWFWHGLRLLAYVISLYFILHIFYKNMKKLEISNDLTIKNNNELKESIKLLKEYKSAIYEGSIISIADLEGRITYVNEQLLSITGYKEDELIGKPHNIFRDSNTPKSVFKEMWETIQNKKTYKGLIKNKKKDGNSFYVKITVVPILDINGDVFEYLALRDDVSELVKSQKELKKHFFTDSLTGLHNRFRLNDDLKEFENPHIALVNIDNFKSVNDFYGQMFGDKVIKEVGKIIFDLSYKYKYKIYRNHGDEFAVVSAKDEDFMIFEQHIKDMILFVANTKVLIDNNELHIELTAGISKGKQEIINADLALKEAKRSQKTVVRYNDNLDIQKIFETNIQWSKKIKEALEDDRIQMALQPLYSNSQNRVTKYESLVRLVQKDGEVISPFFFLDVAKRTKLYGQITRRVIKKSFTILNKTDKEISINICAEDIFDDETRIYLLNSIRDNANSNRLVIELVESEGIENFSDIKEFMDEIKSYNVKLAIDDFGTGYSNFEYLLKLDADYIKIDGSMIKNIDTDPNSYSVVETIVSFARKNNMKVIAEYVSSQAIQDKVLELGIDFSQGYHIDEPRFWEDIK